MTDKQSDKLIFLDYSKIDEIKNDLSSLLGDSYQEENFDAGSGKINIFKNEKMIACIQVNSADKIAYMNITNYSTLPKNDIHTKTIDYVISAYEK